MVGVNSIDVRQGFFLSVEQITQQNSGGLNRKRPVRNSINIQIGDLQTARQKDEGFFVKIAGRNHDFCEFGDEGAYRGVVVLVAGQNKFGGGQAQKLRFQSCFSLELRGAEFAGGQIAKSDSEVIFFGENTHHKSIRLVLQNLLAGGGARGHNPHNFSLHNSGQSRV